MIKYREASIECHLAVSCGADLVVMDVVATERWEELTVTFDPTRTQFFVAGATGPDSMVAVRPNRRERGGEGKP